MSQNNKKPKQKQKLTEESYNVGHETDVEFADERADQEDWEAIERSERADARQQGQYRL
ncbi:hypothetical protein D3C78_1879380 [compost metagenome]